jgi:hypothetical protein
MLLVEHYIDIKNIASVVQKILMLLYGKFIDFYCDLVQIDQEFTRGLTNKEERSEKAWDIFSSMREIFALTAANQTFLFWVP